MTDEQRPQPGAGWVDWPAAPPPPGAPPPVPAGATGSNPHPTPYGAPATPYGAPYGGPANPYGPPADPYGAPATPYGPPANPYGGPASPYGPPVDSYGAPPAQPPYGGSWGGGGGSWGDGGWDPAWGVPPYGDGRPDGTAARPFPVGRRLGFVDSFRSGTRLAGTCWRVLMQDKEDLLVPLVAMLLGAAMILPYVQLVGGWDAVAVDGKIAVLKLFPLMFLLCVVDVFAAATLVGSATIRLSGGNPTLTDGWVQALSRAPKLVRFAFAWAVQQAISAWLRNRGRGGQIAADLFDTAWNVATFLAVPVLLYEPDLSVSRAVKRSAKLVGQRWGPGLVGNTGLQLAVFLCGLPVVLGLGLFGSLFGLVPALVGFAAGLLALISVSSALRGIFSAALYRFATTGLTAPGFREPDLWNAFARPNRRGRR